MIRPRSLTSILLLILLSQALCSVGVEETKSSSEKKEAILGESQSGIIQSGKFPLRYLIEGSGTTTLVIGSALYYPRVFSKNLRSRLRLVFLDHRGFCLPPEGSPDPTKDYELQQLIDDMELARQVLDLGKLVVIGHSGHSFMALEYAKEYPESVTHVVMIGIAPDLSDSTRALTERNWEASASPERKAAMEAKLAEFPDEELDQLPRSQAFVRQYIRNSPRIWYDPEFDCSPFWAGMSPNTEMLDYIWGVLFCDIDITQGLEGLTKPIFLALGPYDFLLPAPTVWEPFREHFQDLTIRIFEKSGHTPQYEEAELFDRELLNWIEAKAPIEDP